MSTLLVEATQATTSLEAVNVMLRSIGESAAVTFMEGGGGVDTESAHATLGVTSRDVQGLGWHFNTDIDLKLMPDNNGYIRLPANTLKVDEVRAEGWRRGSDMVQRGLRLYDRKRHTFAIARPVLVNLVSLLPFEDLPQYARTYITVRAARKFAQDETASDSVSKFTQEDEHQALAELERIDNDHSDPSMRMHSPFINRMLRR